LAGADRASPSVAQELAAQVIDVNSLALPGSPFGVDREIIGQLPSGDPAQRAAAAISCPLLALASSHGRLSD
jgi:hypothetical protein